MARFPLDTRVYVDSNDTKDFYIKHCGRIWYVEAFPKGTLDFTQIVIGGLTTLRAARECVNSWKGWMK